MERVKVRGKKPFSKMSSVIYNILTLKRVAIFNEAHAVISMLVSY